MKTPRILQITAAAILFAGTAHGAEPTTIQITGKVLVPAVERLGVHFGSHNYYDSVILKQRVAENFEGSIHRLHLLGPDQADPQVFVPHNPLADDAMEGWAGADYTVVSGPDFGQRGKILGFEKRPPVDKKKGDAPINAVRLDRPHQWNTKVLNGILIEKMDLKAGQNPWVAVTRTKDENGRTISTRKIDTRYISPQNELVNGDVPPGSFGSTALNLKGSDEPAMVQLRCQFDNAAKIAGDWKVRFWARAKSGAPTLTATFTMDSGKFEFTPGGQWEKIEKTLAVQQPGDAKGLLLFVLKAGGGDVLVDDVEVWQEEGHKNPTPFRDPLVDTLRKLNPGSMRYLRNTRNTAMNSVMPAIKTYSMDGRSRDEFGTHEFYELCEYLKCGAWATLPGTLQPEEIDGFMEYLGAPADVGMGRVRAELGHPAPWTQTLPAIHMQFGNEVITFTGTGFYGPDYWRHMIDRAKKSPYYATNIIFTVNEQGYGAARELDLTPNADRLCLNSYLIFGVYNEQIQLAKDKPGFYEFVFASSWHMWNTPDNNKSIAAAMAGKERNKEICIYEGGNYHTTFGTLPDPPVEQVNRMITGKAGGLSATHNSLILLKKFSARTTESFNLSQFSFSPGGSFGNMPKPVRVWGGVLGIGTPEKTRFRPRFVALEIANKVIGGDLVETAHSGADPKISVRNQFGAGYGPSRQPKEMTVEMPILCSYGFKEGKRRGLILVNQDTRAAQPVRLEFDGTPAEGTARMWVMEGDDLESSNEMDAAPDKPQVTIAERALDKFASGAQLEIPSASMVAIQWTE